MFTHYLKIAFRNLRKYKMQTIISIIGLAVGFVCFALSTLWIRYERSFDAFHPNAAYLYLATNAGTSQFTNRHGLGRTPHELVTYLPERFPEVRNATAFFASINRSELTVNNATVMAHTLAVDQAFFEVFNVRILAGNIDFHSPEENRAVITQQKAQQLFGNENPIGKTFTRGEREHTIVGIVSGWTKPSNFPYDILFLQFAPRPTSPSLVWVPIGNQVIFQLYPGVNVDAFLERLQNHIPEPMIAAQGVRAHSFSAVPLTKMRTIYELNPDRNIRHHFIVLFSLAGLLVILCALFNYFTLFFSRFKMRQKEFALRMVCGASTKSLFALLATEFLSIMVIASALGLLLSFLVQPFFRELSGVGMELAAVLLEASFYFLAVTAVALLVFALLLYVFKKYSLNVAIRQRKNSNVRRLSLVFQLVISITIVFCTSVIIKQLNYLHRVDILGIDFTNTATFRIWEEASVVESKLQQIPEIEQSIVGLFAFFPRTISSQMRIYGWEGWASGHDEVLLANRYEVTETLLRFYNVQLVAGEFLSDGDEWNTAMINESAALAFGWYDAVGRTFHPDRPGAYYVNNFRVKGVLRNFNTSPTVPVAPAIFLPHPSGRSSSTRLTHSDGTEVFITSGVIRFREGTFDTVRDRIYGLLPEVVWGEHLVRPTISSADEAYAELLQSENALLRLLGFVSLICILISVFGFFSLVSLTCEERRKEIAIRKVNGATIHDIVGIFFKEYALLLAIGALIAFPIGYYIMQRWLEQYVLQTPIPSWIYVAILLVLTLVIVLCVGWRVWKASVENPADVVKSE